MYLPCMVANHSAASQSVLPSTAGLPTMHADPCIWTAVSAGYTCRQHQPASTPGCGSPFWRPLSSATYVRVLGVQYAARPCALGPGQRAVRAAARKAVVADAQDNVVVVHNACPNLHVTAQAHQHMLSAYTIPSSNWGALEHAARLCRAGCQPGTAGTFRSGGYLLSKQDAALQLPPQCTNYASFATPL